VKATRQLPHRYISFVYLEVKGDEDGRDLTRSFLPGGRLCIVDE
jgi:hypothetical protein